MSGSPFEISDRPDERDYSLKALRVLIEQLDEDGLPTGVFLLDDRAEVLNVDLVADEGHHGQFSKAEISIHAGEIDTASKGYEAPLKPADFLDGAYRPALGTAYVTSDQYIAIARPREADDPADDPQWDWVFLGLCDRPSYRQNASEAGSERSFKLIVESVWKRLSDTAACQIHGRQMRTAAASDALRERDALAPEDDPETPDIDEHEQYLIAPFGDSGGLKRVDLLPAVFNAKGRPNRSRTPVLITLPEAGEVPVHVFTDDADPDARFWTAAQALRYITVLYLLAAGGIQDGNVLAVTAPLILDPPPPLPDETTRRYAAADALALALLEPLLDFSIEGTNAPEAINLLMDLAGCHSVVAVEGTPSGESPAAKLKIWARGAGLPRDDDVAAVREPKPLQHEIGFADQWPLAEEAGIAVDDLLARHNLRDLDIEVDWGDVLSRPRLLGDLRRYEITTELVPGWPMDAHLDDVAPENLATERDYAEAHWYKTTDPENPDDLEGLKQDPWFKWYHRSGRDFHLCTNVGRRWVLNEHGRYNTAAYRRTTGPFKTDEEAEPPLRPYAPWEPSRCDIADRRFSGEYDASGVLQPSLDDDENPVPIGQIFSRKVIAGDWARVARRLLKCFSADRDFRSLGVVVEFSFNGDAATPSFAKISSATIKALEDEAGIYIETDDLTELVPDGGSKEELNFWQAIMEGKARVQVTAVIEGDSRLEPNYDLAGFAPGSDQSTSRDFDFSEKFHCNRHDGGNSKFAIPPAGGWGEEGAPPQPAPRQTRETLDGLENLQDFAASLVEAFTMRMLAASPTIPYFTREYSIGDTISEITGMGVQLWTYATPEQRRHPDVVGISYTPSSTVLHLDDFRMMERLLL